MTVKELYNEVSRLDDFGANRKIKIKMRRGKKIIEKELVLTGLYSDAVVLETK